MHKDDSGRVVVLREAKGGALSRMSASRGTAMMPLMSTSALPPGLIHATRNPETTRVDMKVLIRLHESLDCVEFKPVRSWFVANLLRVSKSQINRSLVHLEMLGYIERGEQCGNGNFSYRLTIPENGDHSPPLSSAA
jgi:hypothetical protein